MSKPRIKRRTVLKAVGLSTVASSIGIQGISRARAQTEETDGANWSQYRGGATHAGSTAATHPGTVEQNRWAVGSESQPASAPAVNDGTAYVGIGSELIALDITSGSGDWRASVEDKIAISPAVGTDNAFVTTESGDLVALSKADGSEQWRIGLGGRPGAPAVANGTVFAGTTNDRIVAVEATSGDVKWTDERKIDLDDEDYVGPRPTPAVSDGTVFVNISRYEGAVVALDAETGEEQWLQQFDDATEILTPAVSNETVALTTTDPDSKIKVLSANGGILQWETETGLYPNYYPAAVDDELLAVLAEPRSGEMTLQVYDLASGEQRWTYDTEWTPYGVSIGAEAVYFTSSGHGGSGVVGAVGRENGFKQFTREIDFPHIPAHGPVPTGETLLIPDGYQVRALGSVEESTTAVQNTGDEPDAAASDKTAQQQNGGTTEITANQGGTGESQNRALIGGTNLLSLEVIGTIATILASIGTLLQLLQGGD